MVKAVRYFSKLSNTRAIAEAIAEGAGVPAVSIADEPVLTERVDVLEREYFYAHMLNINGRMAAAREFGKRF